MHMSLSVALTTWRCFGGSWHRRLAKSGVSGHLCARNRYPDAMTAPKWPWPGDSPEDRAKRIALSYRQQLGALDSFAAQGLDEHWASLGAGWVKPATAPLDLDEWLTPGEIADKLHIDPRRMRDWARRNRIRVLDVHGVRKYCVGDIIEHMRQTRLRRVSSTMQP